MSKIPAFSICIPAYNTAKYLPQTIESVLNQTFGDFELIIVDDHSTDNTREVVSSYSDPRIKYYFNEKNLGCVPTNNRGISLSSGEYIYTLDSDDLMLPTNLEKKEKLFRENPKVGLVYSDINMIDPQGNVIQESYWKYEGYTPERGMLNARMIASCGLIMPNVATVFRKNVIDKVGYEDTNLFMVHDGEYWLRIAGVAEADYVPEVLCSWRIHHTGRHFTLLSEKIYIERANVVRDISRKYPWAISNSFRNLCIANFLCQGGALLGQRNELVKARNLFADALSNCPYHPMALLWYLNTFANFKFLWDIKKGKKVFHKLLRMFSK